MGVFGKLGSTPAAGSRGQYFRDGKYRVEIQRVVQGESQRGEGPFVAVEGVILDVIVGYEKSNVEGETISWVVMLRKQPAMANLKAFFGAACGIHPDARFAETAAGVVEVAPGDAWPTGAADVTDREWERAADTAVGGAGDTLRGVCLIAEATTISTKRGSPFTRVAWSPDEADDAEAAALDAR